MIGLFDFSRLALLAFWGLSASAAVLALLPIPYTSAFRSVHDLCSKLTFCHLPKCNGMLEQGCREADGKPRQDLEVQTDGENGHVHGKSVSCCTLKGKACSGPQAC